MIAQDWAGRTRESINYGSFMNQFPPDPRLVALTKTEEPSLPNYLPIAGGRVIGFIPFPRVLVLCEMSSVSFRI